MADLVEPYSKRPLLQFFDTSQGARVVNGLPCYQTLGFSIGSGFGRAVAGFRRSGK
ncbi:uncharacterized protein GLRG_04860 [Colletotrichum graminicola M1.001]|uniref:Uncharacterized protein n=1 Tax=Colletotrichum graminicola (strain M1.001 / M2 / FGSC 10212) TaxID=645133 RepID=E3QGC0_COLGM|nr:uncharacterized protein GLRG_04860 [Colletotrichum graminicola M1.001]EFQ29716.1 hypothetical protein GLRG_04860 [Colletotrichum graminicola M1.001]